MKIKKNEIMDYIPIDDTSIAVNNPENGTPRSRNR